MARRAAAMLIPVGVLLALLAGLSATTQGFVLIDTFKLLDGTGLAAHCIHSGVWSSCGAAINQFALLQYLPALAFHEMGFSYGAALNGLIALNGVAVLLVAALVTVVARRAAGSACAALVAAVLLAGPLVWYAHAGFGEPLAALAITGFATSLVVRGPPIATGTAMFFAGISKETAVPLLIALAVAVWLMRGRRDEVPRGEIVAIAVGGMLAIGADIGFNVFRYGAVQNGVYSQAQYRVGFGHGANNFLGLLFSPTAGVFWMWPAFLVVITGAIGFAFRRRRLAEPGFVLAAVFLAVLVLLAAWHAPFGGTTWGPRLLIPWLPALILLSVAAYGEDFRRHAEHLVADRRRLAVVALLLAVTGLPHLIATVDSSRYPRVYGDISSADASGRQTTFRGQYVDWTELAVRPYAPDAECPRAPEIEVDRAYYFKCLGRSTWNKGIVPASAYAELLHPREIIFSAAWLAAIFGLAGFAYVRVRGQAPTLA